MKLRVFLRGNDALRRRIEDVLEGMGVDYSLHFEEGERESLEIEDIPAPDGWKENPEVYIRAAALLRFMHDGIRLKLVPRSGWWYYGIKNPESVADHVYSMSLMAMVIAEYLRRMGEDIDVGKVVRMALIHELGETRIGDIHLEARRYIPRDELDDAERRAFGDVVGILGDISGEMMALYREFEERSSREALIVRAADKLELLFQAHMYEKFGYRNLEAFWETKENFRDFFHNEFLSVLFELIRALRERNRFPEDDRP